MSHADLLALFMHFASLSPLAIGGALGTSPEMHRYLVDERGWLSHTQFVDSIALAQAAPGPNILFVTLLGWQAAGAAGALVSTLGILLPSSLICLYGNRLQAAHRDARLVRAIRRGLSPIAIGLTLSAGWIIAVANDTDWKLALLTVAAAVFFLFSRRNPLWLIGAGAVAGALGLV
ncbi:MAG TPA: chromate transporter [Burkholderiaceae bacterium]|nr:chromate transporter [Burkholderiaceae bacterium]